MKKQDKQDMAKLTKWQDRLWHMNAAYSEEYAKMDKREQAYLGDKRADEVTQNLCRTRKMDIHLVRNITAELIETQVDINIPAPRITPLAEEDEDLAALAEAWLLAELDRIPSETLNDMDERTTRIQGGDYFIVDWDPHVRTHNTLGDLALHVLHPKQFLPQEGVWFDLEEQDYYIIKRPMTRADVSRRYKIDIEDLLTETESEPDIKGADPDSTRSMEELVTVYEGTERAEKGFDRFTWVGDRVLEDLQDFQARRTRKCEVCGMRESEAELFEENLVNGNKEEGPPETALIESTSSVTGEAGDTFPSRGRLGGGAPEQEMLFFEGEIGPAEMLGRENLTAVAALAGGLPRKHKPGTCPRCGGRFVDGPEEYEEFTQPVERTMREPIPLPESGVLTIPRYKPDLYPIVLRRNVPVYGKLLGLSDVDRIADQQNALNVMDNLITDKLASAGSFLVLPRGLQVDDSNGNYKVVRPRDAAEKQLIDTIVTEAPVQADMSWEATVYEHARQQLGITDSYQGRRDATATSGVAKEFSAGQTAGRLESRRIAKNTAWAKVYEIMFKYWLAYSDEPRRVIIRDSENRPTYRLIDRYDFLKMDAAGQWYWNDDFLFSTDDTQPLANNRTQMWQETINAFVGGMYGNPADMNTLILVWTRLEELHYPLAGQTKEFLAKQQEQAMMMQQTQAIAQPAAGQGGGIVPAEQMPQEAAPMQEAPVQQPAPEELPGETVRLDTERSAAMRGEA